MILSDRDIEDRMAVGSLRIDPLDDPVMQIQPASVDLRLAGSFLRFMPAGGSWGALQKIGTLPPNEEADNIIDPRNGSIKYATEADVESTIILPGAFVLGSTIERVTLPNDLVGRLEGRSSLGRLGLIIHATAGYIDPGFTGNITLEISNLNKRPIRIYRGMRVAQISFTQLSSPARRPYGPARESKYKGQVGVTPSKIKEDR